MRKIKQIAESLLNEMDILEVQYHIGALDYFFTVYEYESEFGGIPHTEFEEYTDKNGCEEQREVSRTIEKCDEETTNYFFALDKKISLYRQKEIGALEVLIKIKSLNVTISSLNFYDYGMKKLRDDILKQIVILNSQLKHSIPRADKIAVIQAKKNITVKEFAEIYNISKTSQQNYRGRLYDPLPYHQKVEGGKIVYVTKEVENWFENQHK